MKSTEVNMPCPPRDKTNFPLIHQTAYPEFQQLFRQGERQGKQ